MFIEIKGVEFENKGAELMLMAVYQQIRLLWPDSKIVLSPNANSPYIRRSKLGAYQKLALRKWVIDLNELSYWLPLRLRRYLRKWGIVLESDISAILDASGFSYSDQWGAALRLKHTVAEIRRLKKRGKHYVFLPQAFGPFSNKSSISQLKKGLAKADLILARDRVSMDHLSEHLSNATALRQFNDFTNIVECEKPEYFDSMALNVCIIPNKNMVSPRAQNQSWRETYVPTLVNLIEIAQSKGYKPFLLNHEGLGDQALIDAIVAKLEKSIPVIEEENALYVKAIIQASKIVVCSRFHGCVSALSSGKLCIGTSWSHKYEELFSEYGAEKLILSPDMTGAELNEIFELSEIESEQILGSVVDSASRYKLRTHEMWSLVKQTLGG